MSTYRSVLRNLPEDGLDCKVPGADLHPTSRSPGTTEGARGPVQWGIATRHWIAFVSCSVAIAAVAVLTTLWLTDGLQEAEPSSAGPDGVKPTTLQVRPPLPVSPDVGWLPRPASFIELPAPPARIDQVSIQRIRQALHNLLSMQEIETSLQPEAGLLQTEHRGDIRIDWYRLTSVDGFRFRVGMLARKSGATSRVAVMALHGHEVAGQAVELLLEPRSYQHGVALRLAARGHPVVIVETRSFGASPAGVLPHKVYVNRLRLQGQEFHGLAVVDHRLALSFALARWRPDVDKVAAVGASMGGLSSLLLSIFDERIDLVVSSAIAGPFLGSLGSHVHCPCSVIPGIAGSLDFPHLLAASYAERIALESGANDRFGLGIENLDAMTPTAEVIASQVAHDIVVHRHDGGHEHDIDFVLGFIPK